MTEIVFDELHVVSDLHFGGEPGFQIFNQADTLAATINRLASIDSNRRVGFVMNGDIVDFLAEKPAAYLDPQGAIRKLKRIFRVDDKGDTLPDGEQAFNAVWQAMRNFVAQPNRFLVLVLGNHDVELALPPVTEWLFQALSQGDSAARGRMIVQFDGAGFVCRVHDKKVLCVHGNEGDSWNYVDYWQLTKLSQSMNRGQSLPSWKANAGTRMVIDVMNDIKKDYPMVDLLKPEMEAAVPIVLALEPAAWGKIKDILVLGAKKTWDKVRHRFGFLSAEQLDNIDMGADEEEKILAEFLTNHLEYKSKTPSADDLLSGNFDEAADGGGEEYLGITDYIRSFFGREENKPDSMRKALLEKLENDTTFKLDARDEIYEALDEELGSHVDYLIAGHTHLERALERDRDGCYYFNSGTWIRLIHLKQEFLNSEADFAKIWNAFKAGNIEALDAVNDLGPGNDQKLVLLRPTVVSILNQGGKVVGRLAHASPQGDLQSGIVSGSTLPAEG